MVKITRYLLVGVTILSLGVAIPELFWTAFDKPIRKPTIMYSCIENDFMILRNGKYMDARGNRYSREQYEERLPFLYLRQLMISGTMKDTINGTAMDVHDININNSYFRFKPTDMVTPDPGVYPLFEAESGRASIEMPEDYFRITWRMEFINAKTNKIEEEKSQLFSAALYNKGFEFPARKIAGIPTTRKSCDEGYFLVDQKEQLFHLKMIKGNPYVKKVAVTGNLTFRHIACVDFKDKRYYAYLFDTQGDIFILTQDDYQLIKFPVGQCHAESEELRIYGDLFNYNVNITGSGSLRVVVLDKEYRKVTEYYESWPVRQETKTGRIFAFLFPAHMSLTHENSNFINFYLTLSKGFKWLVISFLLVIAHYMIIRKRGKFVKHAIDLGLILVTGVFGFIAVNIFPNKFYD
jgi:hypothetical protein